MDRRLFLNALLSAAVGQRLLPAAAVVPGLIEIEPVPVNLSGVMMHEGDRLIVYQHPGGWALYSIHELRVPEGVVVNGRSVWPVRHIPRLDPLQGVEMVGIAQNPSMAEQMTADHFRRHYGAATGNGLQTALASEAPDTRRRRP